MATIEGNVVLNGALQAGADVLVLNTDGTKQTDATTGNDGTYSVSASLPCWVIALYQSGGTTYAHEDGAVYVADADPAAPDIVATGSHSISLTHSGTTS